MRGSGPGKARAAADGGMQDVAVVTVVRDWKAYESLVRGNVFCNGAVFFPLDNSAENEPIPVRYNRFLDSFDYSHEVWFVFCHEDFEFLENVDGLFSGLDRGALYGPIGHIRAGLFGFGVQSVRGGLLQTRKGADVSSAVAIGRRLAKPARVETFDCCCLAVHSSLVARYGLRFDERLEFDMYVEDFCASAALRFKIPSYAIQMQACHHSDAVAGERLWRHLPYLETKYPGRCFTGTLAYFGTPGWQKRLQDSIAALVRKIFRACARRSTD